jgi:type I restriction enzyme M protein
MASSPLALFVERDASYFDFRPEIATRQAIKPAVERTRAWWPRAGPARRLRCLVAGTQPAHHRLAGAPSFVGLRSELLHSFSAALEPVGRARALPGARHRRRLLVTTPSTSS